MLTRRIESWFQARLPVADTQLLTQRNVYILPTSAGWMLGITLLTLLVASINFELNLGYLFTFLLAGSALAGMHVGHATLRGITLHLAPPEPTFAGHAVRLAVQLASDRPRIRRGIEVMVRGSAQPTWTDVPAVGATTVEVAFLPAGRGLHAVPALMAQTRFPLGTFRVWAIWRPAATVLVYPAPETPAPPLPPGESRAGSAASHRQMQGTGEPDGVRAYQRGDALRLVVWKKAARAIAAGSADLVSRDTRQAQQQDLWLDIDRAGDASGAGGAGGVSVVGHMPTLEQRLSRLCAWVLQADRLGIAYGLRLPGQQIAPALGAAHRRQCLEALATC